MIVVNPTTRQFNIPGADLVFGVESDSSSVVKWFQCPRYVGNSLDLTGCFIRMNYRNANGEIDSYLVKDLTVEGDNIVFGWELTPKVTMYKGQISYVMCVVGPDTKVKWHTTLGRGQVLEGLEPDSALIENGTADVVAQLIALVEAQTEAVVAEGDKQIKAVQSAAKTAQDSAVAQIEAKRVNTLNSIPNDYTSLGNAVDSLVRGKAPGIVCDVAGSAIAVDDAYDMVIQGLRIFGRSTQNGTPTPESPLEIVSVENPVVTVGGKNLIPPTRESATAQGITSTPVTGSGTIILNGTAAHEISRIVSQNFLLHPGKYTLSVKDLHIVDGNKDRLYLNAADNSGTIINYVMSNKPVTFEVTRSIFARAAFVIGSGSTYNNEVVSVQLELGDTATAYEPYKAIQSVETAHPLRGIRVTSGGNYTDVNGQQWICDEVDLERGVYVQRVGTKVFDGSESAWRRGTMPTGEPMNYIYYSDSAVENLNLSICSHAVFAAGGGYWNSGGYMRSGTGYWQTLTDMTLDEWKAYLAEQNASGTPLVVYYVISNPIEVPLTETELAAYRALHTNKPNTTILNDSGAHMSVRYAADTKLYIDNKLAALLGNI